MSRRALATYFSRTACLLVLGGLAACGGGSQSASVGPEPNPNTEPCVEGQSFASTYDAIQTQIFERHGCTQELCHGSGASGGLDLRREVAYENLIEVKSLGSQWRLVEPGDKDRSYLWLKLAAATRPGTVTVAGSPMPNGLPPLTEEELEAVRLWIYAGAPLDETVAGTESLLGACLPEPEPITIKPLDPPAPDDGIQLVLPPVDLAAASEQEICFATYYDFSDSLPAEVLDPSGNYFRVRGQELRQDPQSHHLVLLYPDVKLEDIHHPAFGEWTCAGGERAGAVCEPTDQTSCGASGYCRSHVQQVALGCAGYGPPGASGLAIFQQVGGAQEAQAVIDFREGVFAQMPVRAILYWSSHAFNLTQEDHTLNGRINFYFAKDQRYPLQQIFDVSHIFSAKAAPYTKETVCADYRLPRGARVFGITSHTHRRGEHFWAQTPDGTTIFENYLYNDPVKQFFDPPLEFDSTNVAERTIHYCATYNNGVRADGSPDPEAVTRASRVPPSATATIGRCTPVACAAGKIGAACNGSNDNATCDSEPGKGDGLCDACPITGGESTENEMFILIGQYFIDPTFPQPTADGPVFAGLASTGPFTPR